MKDAIKAMIQRQIAQHETNIETIKATSITEMVEKEVALFRQEATEMATKKVEVQIDRELMYIEVLQEIVKDIDSMESENVVPEEGASVVEVIDG